ncbi:hypothetical protein E2C01_076433 [Portunus trituberculatus]|uniref:Uncharacterized protein n=1 Tax=Portunus trituberculatus TaxID=210409 RepID=A0A5B7IIU8_PORTR|nr:hypothetical protein [Portunus trituberculatus]
MGFVTRLSYAAVCMAGRGGLSPSPGLSLTSSPPRPPLEPIRSLGTHRFSEDSPPPENVGIRVRGVAGPGEEGGVSVRQGSGRVCLAGVEGGAPFPPVSCQTCRLD